MSDYVKFATSTGDQYLSAMAEMQDTFLKSMTPFKQMASWFPKAPATSFIPELPTAAEITEANFEFVSKWLKQQKKFADKFFATTSPDES